MRRNTETVLPHLFGRLVAPSTLDGSLKATYLGNGETGAKAYSEVRMGEDRSFSQGTFGEVFGALITADRGPLYLLEGNLPGVELEDAKVVVVESAPEVSPLKPEQEVELQRTWARFIYDLSQKVADLPKMPEPNVELPPTQRVTDQIWDKVAEWNIRAMKLSRGVRGNYLVTLSDVYYLYSLTTVREEKMSKKRAEVRKVEESTIELKEDNNGHGEVALGQQVDEVPVDPYLIRSQRIKRINYANAYERIKRKFENI